MLAAIPVIAAVLVYAWFQPAVRAIRAYEASDRELQSNLPGVDEYVPADAGAVARDRLEVFLEIRDALDEPSRRLEEMFAELPPDDLVRKDASVTTRVRAGARALRRMIEEIAWWAEVKDRALLDAEMGLGEYTWIYTTAYYSWLGHSPQDGPLVVRDVPGDGRYASGAAFFEHDHSRYGADVLWRDYRGAARTLASSLLESLPPASPEHASLASALERFGSHPRRVLWQDGLPPEVLASLAPYRDRLAATYRPTTNPFEVPELE